MRVLILGGDGMLGHKVVEALRSRVGFFEVFATVRSTDGPGTRIPTLSAGVHTVGGVEAVDFSAVVRVLASVRPEAVVNCIGVVKQRAAAADPIPSLSVNALFPHRLADLCAAAGVRLVHVSTDCVFSGSKGGYVETDIPDAVDLYGRTKLLGEVSRPGALTLRTSIVGRDFIRSSGLLEWFLAQRGRRVRGYKNAIWSGLTTLAFADVIAEVLSRHAGLSGLFHVAGTKVSKLELLQRFRDGFEVDVLIDPYDDSPCDRSLDGTRFGAATGIRLPSLDSMIAALTNDTTPYDAWRSEHGPARG